MSNQAVATVVTSGHDAAPAGPLSVWHPAAGAGAGRTWPRRGARSAYLGAREGLVTFAVMWAARWTPYMEPEMLGLSDVVGPGSVCVDVGSAAGLYTLALSRLSGRSGQVHSVEPLPFAHPGCARLLRARAAENVRRHSVALGAEPGRALMSVPVRQRGLVTGRSFLRQAPSELGANAEFEGHVEVAVPVETLDSLCRQSALDRLDFVKIDVEGAEIQVLEGGAEVIHRWRPSVLVEIEARHTERYGNGAGDVVDWLTRRGYAMYIWDRGWQRAVSVCPQRRNYLFRALSVPRRGTVSGARSHAA